MSAAHTPELVERTVERAEQALLAVRDQGLLG
jgi:hypothetical protein